MELTPTVIVLGLLVILLAVVAVVLWMRSRRTAELKSRFGPEYERTVHEVGNERKAESMLAEREKRVAKYPIKPLPPEFGSRNRVRVLRGSQKAAYQFVPSAQLYL